MTGKRLIVGLIAMGVVVPLALFYLLHLQTLTQLFICSATCFLFWGVADLIANILSRPRLHGRSPQGAIRDWETSKRDDAGPIEN